MKERQHELLTELFDCVMNCLKVIQCDNGCINYFLMDDEESMFDNEVRASRKIVHSIDVLAIHNDNRSKMEVLHVLGVILIEKISEDVERLNEQ